MRDIVSGLIKHADLNMGITLYMMKLSSFNSHKSKTKSKLYFLFIFPCSIKLLATVAGERCCTEVTA